MLRARSRAQQGEGVSLHAHLARCGGGSPGASPGLPRVFAASSLPEDRAKARTHKPQPTISGHGASSSHGSSSWLVLPVWAPRGGQWPSPRLRMPRMGPRDCLSWSIGLSQPQPPGKASVRGSVPLARGLIHLSHMAPVLPGGDLMCQAAQFIRAGAAAGTPAATPAPAPCIIPARPRPRRRSRINHLLEAGARGRAHRGNHRECHGRPCGGARGRGGAAVRQRFIYLILLGSVPFAQTPAGELRPLEY